MPPDNKKKPIDFKPVDFQADSGPATGDALRGAAQATGIGPRRDASGALADKADILGQGISGWWNRKPAYEGTLGGAPPRSPSDIAGQAGGAALDAGLTAAPFAPGVIGKLAGLGYRLYGGMVGAGSGSTLAQKVGLPGAVGAVPGGLAGLFAPEITEKVGGPIIRALGFGKRAAGAISRAAEEEPSALSGAAREASGGTAATDTALGSQAGPSAPKNASELSSTVQRIRSGTGPGTAASSPSIYTPESLASEQGMSTAALGKPGFNLTMPFEQQEIMRRIAEAPPGTFTPRAVASGGFESLAKPTPFAGAAPEGAVLSPGAPEGPLDAATRGAPGINPAIKAIARKAKALRQQP